MCYARYFGLFLTALFISGAGSFTAAQSFTTLHSFSAYSVPPNPPSNSDGVSPVARLVISGSELYGVTTAGSPSGAGTVFALKTDGTGFTNLHNFADFSPQPYLNSDGASPQSGLLLSGGTLYGTTYEGGPSGSGSVYAYSLGTLGFTNLHFFPAVSGNTFSNIGGAEPHALLCLAGNTLFGTTELGGIAGNGTVFMSQSDGTGFTNLYDFPALDPVQSTNVSGANPSGGVVVSGPTVYGATKGGGFFNHGTVYKLNTDGSGFTCLHQFAATAAGSTYPFTNEDGISPQNELVLSGASLYGATLLGGTSGNGTIFTINTDGTGFTVLHNFTGNDGANPEGLALAGSTLYGVTQGGGLWGNGTVFCINTNGTGFTTLHHLSATVNGANTDGASPKDGVIVSGVCLYGTAALGGDSGAGTVFKVSFEPRLGIQVAGTNLVLSWQTNVAGFSYDGYGVQSSGTVDSTSWTNVSAGIAIENGLFSLKIPVSNTEQFFRLAHP